MTPTPELVARLRRFLGEKIPPGGTEADTRFEDNELEDLLEESQTIYGAASLGWTEKAGMFQEEMGSVEETSTGSERYRFIQLKDRLAYAQTMAQDYRRRELEELDGQSKGGYILSIARPEVL
jgi:hypothetical protein